MSKAFTRESDEDLPPDALDRPISEHPNLVTKEGLAAIDHEINRLSEEHSKAVAAGDRLGAGRVNRDLRYFTHRRGTARLQSTPTQADKIQFGSSVVLRHEDGRRSKWRIVGEDEADPSKGLLSYVSPLARALSGKSVGETVQAGATRALIDAVTL